VPGSVRNSCDITVGRLLEVRVLAGYRTSAEVERFFDELRAQFSKFAQPRHRAVVIADWRFCPPLSDEISKLLIERMSVANPRIQAVGMLVSKESADDIVQFLRTTCGTKNPSRRLFFENPELMSWAHPFLTGSEFRRLRAFLDEGASGHMPVSAARPGRVSPKRCGS
jgi:hypothetical protein